MENGDTAEEALLKELRRLHDAVGVPPRTVDMGKHGRFSPALYADRFGSWEEALEAAGIEGKPQRPPEDIAVEDRIRKEDETQEGDRDEKTAEPDENKKEELENELGENLKEIQRCYERVEGTPTPQDLRERGISVNAVLEEHGTWKSALEASGIETEYVETSPNKGVPNSKEEELLDELRRYRNLNDEEPSPKGLRETEWSFSPEQYRETFGTVEKAVKEAFEEENNGTESDVDELLGEIKRYYLREGTVPEADDVRGADWMPSVEEYRDVFGGVDEAVDATGITDDGA